MDADAPPAPRRRPARARQPRQDVRARRASTRRAPAPRRARTPCERCRTRSASAPRVLPRGGGTKPALLDAAADGVVAARRVAACAGSSSTTRPSSRSPRWPARRCARCEAALAEHGQYLPFDPPLAARGRDARRHGRRRASRARRASATAACATSSSACASSTAPARWSRGGGKVVKNAAGFDLPKLLVGSLGRLGVLVEVALQGLPGAAARTATLRVRRAGPRRARSTRRSARSAAGRSTSRRSTSSRRAALLVRLGGPRRRARAARSSGCAARSALPAAQAASAPTTPQLWRGAARAGVGAAGRPRWSRSPLSAAPRRGARAALPRRRRAALQRAAATWPGSPGRTTAPLDGARRACCASRRRRACALTGAARHGAARRARSGGAFADRVRARPRSRRPLRRYGSPCPAPGGHRLMQHAIPSTARRAAAMADAIGSCVHCGFCLPTCPTYVDAAARRWTRRAAASS